MTDSVRQVLKQAYTVAVNAAHPAERLAAFFPDIPEGRVYVVGAGKAAASMAQAAEAFYGFERVQGLVITRYGHALPTHRIEVVEASHPVPDEAGVAATKRILDLAHDLNEQDTLLCLISGGGSALLSAPDGIALEQKAELTRALLASGADITEMNCVRKHLSRVKGGRLAAAAFPARVITFIVSDVVGDDLSSIASGPTVPDPTSYTDALNILKRYNINMPAVNAHLQAGINKHIPETPGPNDPVFTRVENVLVASAQQSLDAAAAFLQSQGFTPHVLSSSITGEAKEVARVHAAICEQVTRFAQPFQRPCALISGGETTVTVKHKGRGGRNSEFALSFALATQHLEGVHALFADSDGIDGSEDNAGVFVHAGDVARIGAAKARQYLQKNDSYGFFEVANALFVPGPTNTNVNDLRIILLT